MAQLIAGNTVTELTKTSAKVGCTKVTREDLETLLKSMDSAQPKFEVFAAQRDTGEWVQFVMRGEQSGGGWFVASENENDEPDSHGYKWTNRFAQFCIEKTVAAQLLQYLAKRLGYEVYKIYIPSGK